MSARPREIDRDAPEHAGGLTDDVLALLRALASDDPAERESSLEELRRAVCHQGDVHDSTIACVPFLYVLAADPAVGDRGELIDLLVDIGDRDPYDEDEDEDQDDEATIAWRAMCRKAGDAVRAGADVLLSLVDDADPGVRRAAPFALALFHGDGARVVSTLRERLSSERDAPARLALVDAVEAVVRRHPEAADDALALLEELFHDGTEPVERLAALARLLSHVPERLPVGVVPTVVDLLDGMRERPLPPTGPDPGPDSAADSGSAPERPAGGTHAARREEPEDDEHAERVTGEVVSLLRVLHDVLDDRVAERTELVLHRLRAAGRSERVDALWAASGLVRGLRGAHQEVVEAVGRDLADPASRGVAAAVLRQFPDLAAPAADHLAAAVAAEPGGGVTTRPSGAVGLAGALATLARLGDPRAVPYLAAALERPRLPEDLGGAIGEFGDHAAPLVPLLRRRLAGTPLGEDAHAPTVTALLSWLTALTALGAGDALPEVLRVLRASRETPGKGSAGTRREILRAALRAVESLGPAAREAVSDLRALLSEPGVAVDAARALWAVEGDAEAVLPALRTALDTGDARSRRSAASALGRMGPAAASVAPRLREAVAAGGGTRFRAAAAIALWRTAGDAETGLPVLCEAWEGDPRLRGTVADCLTEMGAAAAPAAPLLRAELLEVRRVGRRQDADGTLDGTLDGDFDGDLDSDFDVAADEALLRACRRALESAESATPTAEGG